MVEEKTEIERYSFSKLSTFHTCKLGYKFRYIDHQRGIGNCFSSYGTLVHSLLERYAKGEINLWDLPAVYEWEFDTAVPESFPDSSFCPDMRGLYYEQGLYFLKNFPGYPNIKILEAESEFEYAIDDWIFNGVIDLVYMDKNGLVIEDYKSKSGFKTKTEQAEYARQLYLYAQFVKQKYGTFPHTLRFMMFRKNKPIDISFRTDGLTEALSWAKRMVQEIRECWDFYPTPEEFFCRNLCNHRNTCGHRI